ncbi:MAG TPA: CPXCG motif-containing cysteine-rich protein [Gemmatimonadales bacterium]|nr:CPXCG motif-containing cysteine-rich protein [Gemmatimonadales bacterium]
MSPPDGTDAWNGDSESFEDAGPGDAAAFDTEADVTCPHCGETMSVALDPAGGRAQEYVEDCQVCCRPWKVRLWYDATGAAEVQIQAAE